MNSDDKWISKILLIKNIQTLDIPKHVRSTMARCGVLPLRIEAGRSRGEPVTEHTCKFYNLDEIEDDFHFLLRCTLYNNLGSNFIKVLVFQIILI